MRNTPQKVNSWLNRMFDSRANGIITDSKDLNSFDAIQDFLEAKEHPSLTSAIYYQAFANEDLDELLLTLEEELMLKLGSVASRSCSSTAELIALAGLKMVIFDRSYFFSQTVLDGLYQWLKEHRVNLILVASQTEIYDSEIFNHPTIAQWEQFNNCADLPGAIASGCSNITA